MEDPDRPGDHACPHTLVTSIPDGIHKHKHTHNVNRWIEAKEAAATGWAIRPARTATHDEAPPATIPALLPGALATRRELRASGVPLPGADYARRALLLLPAAFLSHVLVRVAPSPRPYRRAASARNVTPRHPASAS